MNAAGYTFAAIIALAFCYLILVPRWGRRQPPRPRWGRQHKVGDYTADYSQVTAKHLAEIPPEHDALLARSRVVSRRTDVRPMSAERMRSVRHETRKPRAPVRAVPEPRTPTYPLRTREEDAGLDISTLLTIGLLSDGSHYASISPPADSSPDCAPSDSSSSHDSSICDSGGGDGGGGGGD